MSAMNLSEYDVILVNSSAGKDSQAMLDEIFWQAVKQGVVDRMVVIHADLGKVEWAGTKELAQRQAQSYGVPFIVCGRMQENLMEYVERRKMWPDSKARYCTSDFKRGPIRKVMTQLVKDVQAVKGSKHHVRILNCMGLRAQESNERAKKPAFSRDESASNGKRTVDNWLPIHDWTTEQVWARIEESGVEHHQAYDLGMTRLSCVFCVFAPKRALVIAAKANPDLFQEYLALEDRIGHTFRKDFSLHEVEAMLKTDLENVA
jgi:3'-phosphoadenosine 5'-phosphosulfate sulfotransferase (PAPS reductase)/FAD synthetase